MIELLTAISCGLSAGLLGGYLGLGGGIIMVPFMTLVMGLDFRAAVPLSATAIVVNSLAASNEYLKKGMVDFEVVVVLSVFMVVGNITGSNLNEVIPSEYSRALFTVLLIYTAISLLKNRKFSDKLESSDNKSRLLLISGLVALFTGVLAGLLGVGGGVVLVPLMYLLLGLPLATARGTTSLLVGFSAAASSAVFFFRDMIDLDLVAPVILGIIVGGKLGGFLGTLARPIVIKLMFFFLMLYLAFKLSWDTFMGLF